MRTHLERDLEFLKKEILTMGSMVEDAAAKAIGSLLNRRTDLAEEVLAGDDKIDAKELDLEDECLKTLALHQPVAGDLRFITAILKVTNDLERMGDLAMHIARRAAFLAAEAPIGTPKGFEEMAELVQTMVAYSLDALVRRDADLAKRVCEMDDRVDELYWENYRELLERMRKEPEIIDRAFQTISACSRLERIADLATNIAEDIYFMVKGKVIKHMLKTEGLEDN
jgi:phosphate transport system protein